MARITVQNCMKKVQDRFELVVLSAERAKDLQNGTPAFVAKEDDKNTVVALKEIAEDKLNIENLRENLIQSFRKNREIEENIDSNNDLEFIEKEIMNEIVMDSESAGGLNNVSEEELKSI